MREIRLPVWKSKDFQVGVSNLTNINFPSLNSYIKFADIFKYYQQSLTALSPTATIQEIKESLCNFLCSMNISKMFRRVLDLIPAEKGVIPYEHIKTFNSLISVPENRYFCSE